MVTLPREDEYGRSVHVKIGTPFRMIIACWTSGGNKEIARKHSVAIMLP
jgi:hypothetical protein